MIIASTQSEVMISSKPMAIPMGLDLSKGKRMRVLFQVNLLWLAYFRPINPSSPSFNLLRSTMDYWEDLSPH
jgi:hypothetical protein